MKPDKDKSNSMECIGEGYEMVVAKTVKKDPKQRGCDGAFKVTEAWGADLNSHKFKKVNPKKVTCELDDYSVCDE